MTASCLLTRFSTDTRGSTAAMFVISSMAVAVMATAALEISSVETERARLQARADAAALAAASASVTDPRARLTTVADTVFAAQGDQRLTNASGALTRRGDSFIYEATGTVRLGAAALLGVSEMELSARAVAQAAQAIDTEVALVLDVTASMGFGTAWSNARSAISSAVEGLEAASGAGKFNVTLVPYSDRVNIGVHRASWLDGPAPAGWNGCVEPREETVAGNPFALTARAARAKPFDPSAPGRYISPNVSDDGGSVACPSNEIVGPTSDPRDIERALGNIQRTGTGRFDVGMAWGWRVLSSAWRGDWGVAGYPGAVSDQRRKVAVLFTDGYTTAYATEVGNGGAPWGHNRGTAQGFENLVSVCSAMKNDGIEIYTMYVDGGPGNTRIEPYLERCATSADHAFTIDNLASLRTAMAALTPRTEISARLVR